jgi:NAD+ diphosphatase
VTAITHFSGSPLDRVDHVRSDAAAYAALLGDWRARLLVLQASEPQIGDDGALLWSSLAEAPDDGELILLGIDAGRPHFALVSGNGAPPVSRAPGVWRALSLLAADQAAIYGTALSLIGWHNTHRFCPRCGAPTVLFRAGWGRKCTADGSEHFPRTDPVVIMLAEYQGKVLVGRQSRFPPGNYSALAGFLEPGESIEEAVRRELFEEAGVPVGAVRYVASQPWPFGGSQLMIACIAEAEDDAITLDTKELEAAMWVSRAEAKAALAGDPSAPFRAPPPFAIAHTLLNFWVGTERRNG